MTKTNFNIGDKLVCINNTGVSELISNGEVVVCTKGSFAGNSGESVWVINSKGIKHDLLAERFELAKADETVGVGTQNENLHLILKDSCRNFVKLTASEEEALAYQVDGEGTYTVYKLTPVASLKNATVVASAKKR